jgi:hypothetical protein
MPFSVELDFSKQGNKQGNKGPRFFAGFKNENRALPLAESNVGWNRRQAHRCLPVDATPASVGRELNNSYVITLKHSQSKKYHENTKRYFE